MNIIQACSRRCMLLLVLCLLLTACGKQPETAGQSSSGSGTEAASATSGAEEQKQDDGRIRIGFVVKENSRSHWIRMKEAAGQACAEQGAELIFLSASSNVAAAEQIEKIDELIAEDVDAICVAPISDEMVYHALGRAVEQGIPVFAVDTDTAFPEKQAYIGTDNYEAARAGAVYAAEQCGNSGNAVILRGTPGDSAHDARAEGIADGLTASGMEVLETCYSAPDRARSDVQKLLQKWPDLDLVITTEDEITKNAWQLILTTGNTSVKLYGFDGTEEVSELAAKDSQVIGTTAQFPEKIGKQAVETVLAYLAGEPVPAVVTVPWQIIGEGEPK